jgi:Rod binding domain-containing protein
MDSSNMILTESVSPPALLEQLDKKNNATEEQKKQFSKDFESVFLERLFGEMKKTVVDWSDEKDGADEQIDGLFWMYLARDMADKGGVGLWKDIYKSITNSEQKDKAQEQLDKRL